GIRLVHFQTRRSLVGRGGAGGGAEDGTTGGSGRASAIGHRLGRVWPPYHAERPNTSDMSSARVAGLSRNPPRIELVMVIAPGLRTPRIVMHEWLASTITPTPRAS